MHPSSLSYTRGAQEVLFCCSWKRTTMPYLGLPTLGGGCVFWLRHSLSQS
jgi:hypothetical protein